MTRPRPWHRSRLFWLGATGLIFLLWTWFIPSDTWTLGWGDSRNLYTLEYQAVAIRVRHMSIDPTRSPIAFGPADTDPHYERIIRSERDPIDHFDSPLSWEKHGSSKVDPYVVSRKLTLPFWFLVPLYLTAWLTTLHLWQRRKHRLLENTTTPSP